MYLHNAIVAVNILQIPLLEMPLEYLGQANLMGQIFVLWQNGIEFLVTKTIQNQVCQIRWEVKMCNTD